MYVGVLGLCVPKETKLIVFADSSSCGQPLFGSETIHVFNAWLQVVKLDLAVKQVKANRLILIKEYYQNLG